MRPCTRSKKNAGKLTLTRSTFCFEVIAGGTIADGAELDLEIVPVRGTCRGCGEGFIVEDFLYICPKCQGRDIEITGGTELRIKDIEVD